MERPSLRFAFSGLLAGWGLCGWGSNFFRGVALALASDRAAGKEVMAAWATRLLGSEFPFRLVHLAMRWALLAIDLAMIVLLLQRRPTDPQATT